MQFGHVLILKKIEVNRDRVRVTIWLKLRPTFNDFFGHRLRLILGLIFGILA